jgi:hypothetical protein
VKELERVTNESNDYLIVSSICLIVSTLIIIVALSWMAALDRYNLKQKINDYENTMIETDYCDDNFEECYRTYQTFKEYYETNKNK